MSARTPQTGEVWKFGATPVEILAVAGEHAWVVYDGQPLTLRLDALTPGEPVADEVAELWWHPVLGFTFDDQNAYRTPNGWTLVATVARMSDGTFRIDQVTT